MAAIVALPWGWVNQRGRGVVAGPPPNCFLAHQQVVMASFELGVDRSDSGRRSGAPPTSRNSPRPGGR